MADRLLIDGDDCETRIALIQDGRLVDVRIDRNDVKRLAGNVYRGRVVRLAPGMQGVFVDVGLDRPGFLAPRRARGDAAAPRARALPAAGSDCAGAGRPGRRRRQGRQALDPHRTGLGADGARTRVAANRNLAAHTRRRRTRPTDRRRGRGALARRPRVRLRRAHAGARRGRGRPLRGSQPPRGAVASSPRLPRAIARGRARGPAAAARRAARSRLARIEVLLAADARPSLASSATSPAACRR